ncbi:hypothetical protein G5I_14231 [Acromyrmex echinatior]|uniref:Uncharacterized protein n=1 Tax=Acromyrmex echinatior TaxID=103372 RepID=F4X793_ACREC|nr:hypothetical protein G5I_14231 [Acromyrmex echinatior]
MCIVSKARSAGNGNHSLPSANALSRGNTYQPSCRIKKDRAIKETTGESPVQHGGSGGGDDDGDDDDDDEDDEDETRTAVAVAATIRAISSAP